MGWQPWYLPWFIVSFINKYTQGAEVSIVNFVALTLGPLAVWPKTGSILFVCTAQGSKESAGNAAALTLAT